VALRPEGRLRPVAHADLLEDAREVRLDGLLELPPVGVDHAAVTGPDLDPHDPVTKDAIVDDAIEPCDRLPVARDDTVGDCRLDDAPAARLPVRFASSIALVGSRSARHLYDAQRKDDQGGEAGDRKDPDGAANRPRVGASLV